MCYHFGRLKSEQGVRDMSFMKFSKFNTSCRDAEYASAPSSRAVSASACAGSENVNNVFHAVSVFAAAAFLFALSSFIIRGMIIISAIIILLVITASIIIINITHENGIKRKGRLKA